MTHIQGDWIIDEPTVVENKTIIVDGHVYVNADTVMSNGTLFAGDFIVSASKTIDAGFEVDLWCNSSGEFKVEVKSGATLNVYGNITNNPQQYHYWFYMNGTLLLGKDPFATNPGLVENTMGSPDLSQPGGIICTTDNVRIENGAEVRYGKTHGVWLEGSDANISGAKIHDNGGDGIVCVGGSAPLIEGNNISWNMRSGIAVKDSNPIIRNSNLIQWNGVHGININNIETGDAKFEGNVISNNFGSGIWCEDATVTVANNSISSNGMALLFRDDMEPYYNTEISTFSTTSEPMITRSATSEDIDKLKELYGTYEEGIDYNYLIDGFETGLIPPTEEEWEEMTESLIMVESIDYPSLLSESVDNSASPYFPPIGLQKGNTCIAWALCYYTKTFQEAKEHDWDLSSAIWEVTNEPTLEYQDKIMSPYFHYNLNGGFGFENLINIGVSSWKEMPPVLNEGVYDENIWPSENAWREAPLYRTDTYGSLLFTNDIGINDLKEWLSNDNLAVIAVSSSEYTNLTQLPSGDYIWTSNNYNATRLDHENTIVGYDNNFGPYIEGGQNRTGAFKIANSWGNISYHNDGFYWISYEAMKLKVIQSWILNDRIGYEPKVVAVFNVTHPSQGECDISFGVGNKSNPESIKSFDVIRRDQPFPVSDVIFDISEIVPVFLPKKNLFMSLYDSNTFNSNENGTIIHFSVECYDDYANGIPKRAISSPDPPISTIKYDTVYAELSLVDCNWDATGLWHKVQNQPGPPYWNISKDGEWSWWFGNDLTGNYDQGVVNGSLKSNYKIPLNDTKYAFLSLWSWYETDTMGTETDQRWLRISNETTTVEIQLHGEVKKEWTRFIVNITEFIGSNITVEFIFNSITAEDNSFQGWYIDLIEVFRTYPNVEGHGIYLNGGNHSSINNNSIYSNNWDGISLSNIVSTTIENNNLNDNRKNMAVMSSNDIRITDNTESNGTCGIYLESSTEITIFNNSATMNIGGIGLLNSNDNSISNSIISSNYGNGIHLDNSNNNSILNITAISNYLDGINLLGSSNNIITNNTASLNKNRGIAIQTWSNDLIITNNIFNSNQEHGILIQDCVRNIFSANNASHNFGCGIYSLFNEYISFINNTANSNKEYGICLLTSYSSTIVGNTVNSNNCSGIFLDNSDDNTVANNTVNSNNEEGIWLDSSDRNTILSNTANSNYWDGICLMTSSRDNKLIANNASSNVWYGIFIMSKYSNILSNNTLSNNEIGIYLYYSMNLIIENNTLLLNNDYGIYLYYASNNEIYHNKFINNTNQAYDNGVNVWHNGYPSGGNYWSDYTGFDEDSGPNQDIPGPDGIGDTPYTSIQGGIGAQDDYPLMAVPTFGQFSIPLVLGWNLLSIPFIQDNTSVPAVLSSIEGQWDRMTTWDNVAKVWLSYRVWGGKDFTDITHQMGFWIHILDIGNGFLTVEGRVPMVTSIPLYYRATPLPSIFSGWNMVGYPSATPRTFTDTLAGTYADVVAVYDGTLPAMQRDIPLPSDEMMTMGNGYWIHVTEDCVWTVGW